MTDPLQVVFIDHTSENGGAELALARLLDAGAGWRATLVVPTSDDGREDVFTSLSSQVDVVRAGPKHSARKLSAGGRLADAALALRIVRSAVRLVSLRAVRRADVMVANTTRASVFVALAGMVLRKPVVVHIRDLIEPASIGGAATALMRRLVLPRAAAVIANSRASLELVAPYVSSDCVQAVVPSPAGLNVVPDEAVSVPERATRIGMIARLDPWKGQELLIEAFARAFPEGDQTLTLFGGVSFGHDDFPARLAALAAQHGVESRVEFPGHVSDVAGAIASLDVCVQCSTRAEPLGQNVLQYLAAAKPTVVAGEGGPAEWVTDGENGLVFEPRKASSLAACLRRLVDDAALRNRLAHGARSTPGLASDSAVAAEVHRVLRRATGDQR